MPHKFTSNRRMKIEKALNIKASKNYRILMKLIFKGKAKFGEITEVKNKCHYTFILINYLLKTL